MTIDEAQNEIIEEFEVFDDWMDKYNYLIDLSNELPAIDPKFKTKEYLIEGCQSKVWLRGAMEGSKIVFTAESDAIITRGIVALLIRVLSGREPHEIIENELYFIERIGLKENLSPSRSNGLLSMLKQMKLYAIAFQAKQNM